MSGSQGSSQGSSTQAAKPLTGAERAEIFNAGVSSIGSNINSLPFAQFQAPTYQSAGTPLSMSPGDYQAMQQSLYEGGKQGLDYAKGQDLQRTNSDLAKRGIWSSGLAEKAITDKEAMYAPQYAAAGATAAGTAAGLQGQQNQSLNALDAANAASINQAAQSNAANVYNSEWAPLNYLQGIYNQTGGTVSQGVSSNSGSNVGWNSI